MIYINPERSSAIRIPDGGNMHNSVVKAVRNALIDEGFTCLRFNFRGTGGSWGKHGNGIDELEDVLAAVDFLEARSEVDGKRLVLAGYSSAAGWG